MVSKGKKPDDGAPYADSESVPTCSEWEELAVLRVIVDALLPLNDTARCRILTYISDRFNLYEGS